MAAVSGSLCIGLCTVPNVFRGWHVIARRGRVERRIVRVNGEPAIATFILGHLHSVATIDTDGERIQGFYSIAHPDKLSSFDFLSLSVIGASAASP